MCHASVLRLKFQNDFPKQSNELTRPKTSFELPTSQGESWCEMPKRSSHNFMENKITSTNYQEKMIGEI
jgi:hypothetical protein